MNGINLAGADTLLRSRHETERQQPLVQRNFAIFHDRANGDGKTATTGLALDDAAAGGLAAGASDALCLTTTRTNWTVRPMEALQVLASFVCVAVDRVAERDHRKPLRQVYNRPSNRWS